MRLRQLSVLCAVASVGLLSSEVRAQEETKAETGDVSGGPDENVDDEQIEDDVAEDAPSPSSGATRRDSTEPPTEDSTPQDADAPVVLPPTVLNEVPPVLPADVEREGRVILVVVVGADGRAEDVTVEKGLSPTIDAAAKAAVENWIFAPATRDGVPLAARIQVAVAIRKPQPKAAAPAEATRPHTPQPELPPALQKGEHPEHDHAHEGDVHMQITVHGERPLRTEQRTASDYFVHREVLSAAPHQEGAEMLRTAPGLTAFRSEGLAQAHSYSLRGFDAEHGQDIEFSVGGLPINLPSHIHGQGYSDLSFLIGPVVDALSVKEGVSDPRQGDFAVAGSVQVALGVDEEHRGLQLRSGYGSFDTQRHQIIWAPKEAERESVGAAQVTSTDGFGQSRAGDSASGVVQHRFGKGDVRYRAIGFVHGARGQSAGVVRKDDIDSGLVCFHCTYPDATARAQNALSQRIMAGFFADYRGPAHANGTFGFYLGRDHYRSQQNFTGYQERSQTLPGVSGRGDLIEQMNDTTTFGLLGRYRTEAFEPAEGIHGTVEVGVDGRFDAIDQSQSLLDATVRNQTWDHRVDARIHGATVGLFGDLDFQFGERVHARVGARAAVLSYDVNDRLGNFAPQSRPQDQSLPGFRRSAMGATVGPRSSLEVKIFEWMKAVASYGEGYRSPQARTLQDGERAPFAKVRSGDTGLRFHFGSPLSMSVAGYYTHLSDDVIFEASEGRLERIGPTRRAGVVGYAQTRPTEWLLSAVSVTYVNTAVLSPPPATAEEPDPPFEKGAPLPFVPPLIVRLDTSAKRTLLDIGRHPLLARVGLGATYLAPRPLPYNQSAKPVVLLDASTGLGWGPLDLDVSAFNLLDLDYAAREFYFVSNWQTDNAPSRLPGRHIAAGSPFALMATLGVSL